MKVHDFVQETRIKTIPEKKKCKKAKWLSEEAFQIAEKREVKGKGEKEWYTHLNAEFQRVARGDKKAFLSDQCKEIEENNKMGKTRDHLKKIGDTKGISNNVEEAEVEWLRNSMDRGAWQATVREVSKSWTWLNSDHKPPLKGYYEDYW